MSESLVFGGLETGGTTCACAVGDGLGRIERFVQFDTADAASTLARARAFFRNEVAVAAIGIAAFGPVALDPSDVDFGQVLNTPKPDWAGANVVHPFRDLTTGPVTLDTDVGASAYGEQLFGAGHACRTVLYVTVGTGIGGALVVDGKPCRGASHAEMGHISVRAHPDDSFEGACPHHGACLEGLASGAAIEARTGHPARDLAPDDPVWEWVGYYLGQALTTYTMVLMPDRVVLGGGIGAREDVRNRTRVELGRQLGGYPAFGPWTARDAFVVAPALGTRSGVVGAMAQARAAFTAGGG
jgi:fructokinase